MLHLVQSNKMEVLAEALMLWLQNDDGASIFETNHILVQSPGMAQWLKIQIAEKTGIAANLEFPLPSSYIWQLYRKHLNELPEQSAFTKDNMAWKLMAVLPGLLSRADFSALEQYLKGDKGLKLYQLCHKIADVYDQYLVYRPDWILSWESGGDSLPDCDSSRHPWQSVLWRALLDYSGKLGESAWHRANLHQGLITKLQQQNDTAEQKPLLVFGLSAMPMQQLEVLAALGQSREVVIFWFNPCQHYWGDIVDGKTLARAQLKQAIDNSEPSEYLQLGNPLLSSWGKLGRDYQDMLLNLDMQQHDGFIVPEASNLLEHLQSEVLNLQFRGSHENLSADELLSNGHDYPKIPVLLRDRSIQFHACHSMVRELEVLHDQLLHLFNQNPHWQPGDVIVMMPDVATYAPFIDGVFGGVQSELYIPYAISDRQLAEESPLIASFKQLMTLHQSRLTLSEVMALCEVPAIQAKFDISLTEYELLCHWLTDVGVRWGWDENDKARWELPQDGQNTWLFGLQRMLAGYAMDGQDLYQGNSALIAPYGDIEGQQALALGKFYLFVQELLKALKICQQQASIAEKVSAALQIIERLYVAGEHEEEELLSLRHSLEQMLVHQRQFPQAINQDVFVSELTAKLSDKGTGQRFLAGYVNFCTLMPMRSIPFKAVCLLGMNDADYPRQVMPLGFDLMREAKNRRGDRSRRLDDRYLFLEAILSARELLYLSYVGRNQKDNSELNPSILLSELLEHCQHCYCLEGDDTLEQSLTRQNLAQHLRQEHSLQPFALANFQPSEGEPSANLQSFQPTWLDITKQQGQIPQTKPFMPYPLAPSIDAGEQQIELELQELIAFFHNPVKAFFMSRWQTRLGSYQQQLLDDEPFDFDTLQKFQLNQRLVEQSEVPDTAWSRQLKAEGKLPLANTGDLHLQLLLTQSQSLQQKLANYDADKAARPQEIALEFSHVRLVGWIDHVFADKLVMWRSGNLRTKDRLSLYLSWLALCASKSRAQKALFLTLDKDFVLTPLPSEEAYKQLTYFVEYWQQGQQQLLHFYPESAWVWLTSGSEQKTLQAFYGSAFSPVKAEGQEVHIQRACPDLALHFAEFCGTAEQLLSAMLSASEAK